MKDTVRISLSDFEYLVGSALMLDALYATGIDNAEAFDEAERPTNQDVVNAMNEYRID